jgi:hypothetical protein
MGSGEEPKSKKDKDEKKEKKDKDKEKGKDKEKDKDKKEKRHHREAEEEAAAGSSPRKKDKDEKKEKRDRRSDAEESVVVPSAASSAQPQILYSAEQISEMKKLYAFYSIRAPDKLGDVVKNVVKYTNEEGGFEKMWRGLEKKYTALSPDESRYAETIQLPPELLNTVSQPASGAATPAPKSAAFATSTPPPETDRTRLVRFYLEYAPHKIGDVEALLQQYKGNYDAMWKQLVDRYGPEPAPPPAHVLRTPSSLGRQEAEELRLLWKERLRKFYQHYKVLKTDQELDEALRHYQGNAEGYQRMWGELLKKYGAEPVAPTSGLVRRYLPDPDEEEKLQRDIGDGKGSASGATPSDSQDKTKGAVQGRPQQQLPRWAESSRDTADQLQAYRMLSGERSDAGGSIGELSPLSDDSDQGSPHSRRRRRSQSSDGVRRLSGRASDSDSDSIASRLRGDDSSPLKNLSKTITVHALLRFQGCNIAVYDKATEDQRITFCKAVERDIAFNINLAKSSVKVTKVLIGVVVEMDLELFPDQVKSGVADQLVSKVLMGTFTVQHVREAYRAMGGNSMQLHAEGAAVFGGTCTAMFQEKGSGVAEMTSYSGSPTKLQWPPNTASRSMSELGLNQQATANGRDVSPEAARPDRENSEGRQESPRGRRASNSGEGENTGVGSKASRLISPMRLWTNVADEKGGGRETTREAAIRANGSGRPTHTERAPQSKANIGGYNSAEYVSMVKKQDPFTLFHRPNGNGSSNEVGPSPSTLGDSRNRDVPSLRGFDASSLQGPDQSKGALGAQAKTGASGRLAGGGGMGSGRSGDFLSRIWGPASDGGLGPSTGDWNDTGVKEEKIRKAERYEVIPPQTVQARLFRETHKPQFLNVSPSTDNFPLVTKTAPPTFTQFDPTAAEQVAPNVAIRHRADNQMATDIHVSELMRAIASPQEFLTQSRAPAALRAPPGGLQAQAQLSNQSLGASAMGPGAASVSFAATQPSQLTPQYFGGGREVEQVARPSVKKERADLVLRPDSRMLTTRPAGASATGEAYPYMDPVNLAPQAQPVPSRGPTASSIQKGRPGIGAVSVPSQPEYLFDIVDALTL